METIEERARQIAEKWKSDIIRGGEDLSFTHLEYVAKQAATEQDRIARAEERERCIRLAQEWYCNEYCTCATPNSCKAHDCKAMIEGSIRKTMEGGNNGNA